jgi:hypothetical protein
MSQAVFTNDIFPQPKFHPTIPSNGFEKSNIPLLQNSLMSDAIEEHVPILENTHNYF